MKSLINSDSQFLNIYYTNANDLKNKIHELELAAKLSDCKVLGVTETMFSDDIMDAEVSIANFKLFRIDRKTKGGGSCLYVHDSIQCHEIIINVPDCMCVKLMFDCITIIVYVIYRAPSLPFKDNKFMLESLSCSINKLSADNEIVMMGDFNLPDVLWDSGSVACPFDTNNQKFVIQQMFLDFFVKHDLSWVIGDGVKTRRRTVLTDIQAATLDNVLTSDRNIFMDVHVTAPLGKSDHIGIVSKWRVSNNAEYITHKKRNWAKMSPESIIDASDDLSWDCDSNSVDTLWNNIHESAMKIVELVPISKINVSHTGAVKTKSVWDRPCLEKARKTKEKCWAEFENFPTSKNHSIALSKQRLFDKCQKEAMMRFENSAATQLKRNPKAFYSYINSKRKIKAAISGLRTDSGRTLTAAKDIANELGAFFESTFVQEDSTTIPGFAELTEDEIPELLFNAAEVKILLSRVNIWKSIGPDDIHPKLLKTLANNAAFVRSITHLFQTCYDKGTLPEVWKQANVTALHKKGDKAKASNYRPISLTCILSKIFEKIIRNHILSFVTPMIVKEQHGFLPGKSCVSNLLECIDTVNDILGTGSGSADILYLDFQKAFDSVPHRRLLKKLEGYGIKGNMLAIIGNFLTNRKFRVRVGSTFSDWFKVTSGVPQGTVLGPLLFLLFINDLPCGLQSFVSLFADDLKLVTSADKHNIAQEDIDKLNKWEQDWLLRFNVKDGKCKVLHVGKNNPKNAYFMNSVQLPAVEDEKDLGVLTSRDLHWNSCIEKAVSKAKSTIGWITRSLICRNKFVMINVYKSLVRPHIEYAVQVWNPPASHGYWKLILQLEEVQRSFTRLIDGIGILPYSERLMILQLTTLLERRMRGDLIETFKITTGKVSYGKDLFRISRSGTKILKDKRGDGILSNRVANYWNKIPAEVKEASSVDAFKARLEQYKAKTIASGAPSCGHYWELSDMLISKINDSANHDSYANYMSANPSFARFKGVNVNPEMK